MNERAIRHGYRMLVSSVLVGIMQSGPSVAAPVPARLDPHRIPHGDPIDEPDRAHEGDPIDDDVPYRSLPLTSIPVVSGGCLVLGVPTVALDAFWALAIGRAVRD